jgi:hypothetical protein
MHKDDTFSPRQHLLSLWFRWTESDGRIGVHRADSGDLRRPHRGSEDHRASMSDHNVIGLVLVCLVALFLFVALLFPEKF